MALNASTPALRHHLARVAAAASMSSSTLNQQLGGLALLQQQYSTTAHDAPQLQLQRLQQAITPQVCADLVSKGYAVADGVFGPTVARQLKRELLQVYSRGLMHHNHTHIVARAAGTTQLLPKAHIHEAELTLDPSIQAAAPVIAQLNADTSLATMLSLHIPQLRLEAQAIKLQHNTGGGGCFPMHFDSDAAVDGRRVTAIIYVNDDWVPGAGGELRLYPFPAPPVDIQPVADRVCLFASTSMLHRVLPSKQPRSCFTIWLSEGERRAASSAAAAAATLQPPPSDEEAAAGGDAVWRFLMQPAVRQHVCRLAYAGEWERSILESHPPSGATQAALDNHRAERVRIEAALRRMRLPLQQLLAAADAVAAAAGYEHAGAKQDSPSEAALQEALGVLRAAAAHVRWL